MKPKHYVISIAAALVAFYFLAGNAEKKAGIAERKERITVITATADSQEFQPDMESYRAERDHIMADMRSDAKYKPDFRNAAESRFSHPRNIPDYKTSPLRSKVAPGPIDEFGGPVFVPSETAMADPKIFEQEYARHKERSENYVAARIDEMKINTEVERKTMQSTIETAKASGTRTPEEIKRAEDALARMQNLEKILKGEKVERID